MIVILEGPDGAGKSTLAQALYNALSGDDDTSLIHHGPYKGLESNELAKTYFGSMTSALTYNKHVILDRSWYSESIYGDVYRSGANRIPMIYRRMLERAALSRGAILVKCLPSLEACLEAFEGRPEYLDSTAQLTQVFNAYHDWTFHRDDFPAVVYNRELEFNRETHKAILRYTPENPYSGGGRYAKGNVLVLCSKWRVAHVKPGAVVVPYVNFNETFEGTPSASNVITTEFERQSIPEQDIYWVNVENTRGETLDSSIIEDMAPSHIIAIGAQPLQWCRANGVEHHHVSQPRPGQQFNLDGVFRDGTT